MDKKLLFIVNPRAGRTKSFAPLFDAVACFSKAGYLVKVFLTEGRGDATRAAAELGGAYDLVVCAGGDGTFNEMVSGLMQLPECPEVGYLPNGSTNDFAASLKIPSSPVLAARQIVASQGRDLDIGRFQDRYFVYVASFGAFTKASYSTPQSVKNALGHVAYVLQGAKELFQIPKEHVAFQTDSGSFEGDYIFGAISNSTSVGGILTLDPSVVDMQDGKFELMLIRPPKDAVELMGCIQALTGQRYDTPMLTFCSASCLTVTANPEMPWTLDGEKEEGHETVEVENLHRAIRLIQKGAVV